MDNWRGSAHSFGMLLLALFLILYGFTALASLAIPGWVIGATALLAGILLLVGK